MALDPGGGLVREPQSFMDYLGRVRPLIDARLAQAMPTPADAHPDLDGYLYGPTRHFACGAGKRMRPALCLLGCEAVGGSPEDALDVAAALEVFQAAALIHDDIADKSQTRRGEPCLHLTQGIGPAINDGDLAIVDVFGAIIANDERPAAPTLALLREVEAMMRRTLEGQALDLCWVRDNRWDLKIEDYLVMATLKTAHYTAASPLALGATIGGGTPEQVEALREFGLGCGLAFQVADDLLCLCGDTQQIGKDALGDLTEGKRTLAVVFALRNLGEDDAAELMGILRSRTSDQQLLTRAVELIRASGAIDYCERFAHETCAAAKRTLATAGIDERSTLTLLSMADAFVDRTS